METFHALQRQRRKLRCRPSDSSVFAIDRAGPGSIKL